MQATTQHVASSQQAFGTPASRDHKSDRAFAATLGAMLLAVMALPFAGAAQQPTATDTAADPAQRAVEQMLQVAPATATLEAVVITGHRRQQQAEAQAATSASRS
jgi:hypothetical protein